MLFAHDAEVALVAAAALINTARPGVELLATPADLAEFYRTEGWTGRHDGDGQELAAVRDLRPRLRAIWVSASQDPDGEGCVALLNSLLADTGAAPWLTRHSGMPDWHLHVTRDAAPLADRMGAEAAMALVDVVRSGMRSRLKLCAAADCEAVLIDLSRNRSRRYCDTGNCGNREHVAAYRARLRSGAG